MSAQAFTLPLRSGRETLSASYATPLTSLPAVFVQIHTDDGLVGVAEAPARPQIYGETRASIVEAVAHLLGPRLLGLDPLDIERIRAQYDPPLGPAWNPTAKAAIDIAVHDLIGKVLRIPVYRYLGGWLEPARVELCTLLSLVGSNADLIAEAEERYHEGYRGFKIKVGHDVVRDVALVRDVRRAVGDDALLYIDANESYSADDAIVALRRMADVGVAYAEDPCSVRLPRDIRKKVADSVPIPILGDNACFTPDAVLRELQDGTIGMVLIKTARTGFSASRRIADLAHAFGVRCLVASQGDSAIGTLASGHFVAGVRGIEQPCELSYMLRMVDQIATVATTPPLERAVLSVPDRPGIGVEIDPDRLARYAPGVAVYAGS